MNNKIHIAWYKNQTSEGGLARNYAFAEFLSSHGFRIINICPSNIIQRLINIFRLTLILMITKNSIIFLHGNYFITNYLVQIFHFNLYVKAISYLMNRVAKSNRLIIEINDLRYEQSLDVKTKNVTKKFDNAERKILYEVKNVKYVFASSLMRDYAITKYNLKKENTIVLINGGPVLSSKRDCNNSKETQYKIKYVYAGTLNKGRQIENMIEIFLKCEDVELYLLGTGGDWISREYSNPRIIYLGSLSEAEAHIIVSKCDIGLIPYDGNGFYYNICYPTKASFYLTAGIPFISTKIKELVNNFEGKNICIFEDIEKWEFLINSIDNNKIDHMRKSVLKISDEYTWRYLLKGLNNFIYE